MKHLSFSLPVVIVAAIFLVSCRDITLPVTFTNIDEMRLFESSEFGFSMKYPASWIVDELPDGNHGDKEVVAMFFVPAPFPGVFVQQKIFENPILEDVARWGKERILDRYDEYQLNDLYRIVGNDREKFTRTYHLNMTTGSNIHGKDVYLVHGNKGILTLRATESQYEELLPVFEAMVDSFTIGEIDK
jgi:hypothetical protein